MKKKTLRNDEISVQFIDQLGDGGRHGFTDIISSMVQFVKGGPDIPEDLLRAHEAGDVVFFCGAGISRQAGLPSFYELVEQCYEKLCTDPTSEQRKAIASGRYDKAIGLLEETLGPNRIDVRRTIAKRLHEYQEQHGIDTHRALLMLAQHQNRTRLITTNFDHLFEKAAMIDGYKIDYCDPAALLSDGVHTWDSVVYLHGRMPELSIPDGDKSDDRQLERLVLTSGDFARAYLRRRQVTDFIQQLFFLRRTICFVGYSLDDVMFQYLLDGHRAFPNHFADKDTSPPKLYAFVGVEGDLSMPQNKMSQKKWEGLDVEIISYYCKKPTGQPENHAPLHDTLRAWAQSMGVAGKIKIIEDSARKVPYASTPEDNFVGRVLWAIKDASGKPAEHFSSLTPAPPLEWLELSKSMVNANDTRTEQISLFEGMNVNDHNDVIRPLSYWLACHLNDPRVLVWLTRQYQELRQRVTLFIQMYLRLKDESGSLLSSLDPGARRYWQLFLGKYVLCELHDDIEFLDWQALLVKNGLTTASKKYLLRLLEPMLVLELKPEFKPLDSTQPQSNTRHFDDVMCELRYPVDRGTGVSYWLENHPDKDNWHSAWQKALPELFFDINRLLRDGLDLLRMAGRADNERDLSYIARHSISDHERDHNHGGGLPPDTLGLYITLTRDAWLAKHKQHPEQSKADATQWMREPYPVFKRLAFFAVTQSTSIESRQALGWLLADGRTWLWSGETRREAIQLIVYLAPKLDAATQRRLEQAILEKPPQLNDWDIGDWDVYLRLARLKKYLPKEHLGNEAQIKLDELRKKNPGWSDNPDEDVEFPYGKASVQRIGEPGDGRAYHDIAPNRESWVQWIKKYPNMDFRYTEDGWAKFCDTHFPTAVRVLDTLTKDNSWPVTRWHNALNAWVSSKDSKCIHHSWRHISPLLGTASEDFLLSLGMSLGGWILKAAEQGAIVLHDETLLIQLSKRLLELPNTESDNIVTIGRESVPDYISQFLNSRVGRTSQALLVYWYSKKPRDNAGLPKVFKNLFTRMCDAQQESLRCARVALACYALPLFRVDPEWTKKHLLPLFDWDRDTESHSDACAVWQGYLRGSVSDLYLLKAIKPYFLPTAKYDADLGETARAYYIQLIDMILGDESFFTNREYKQAIASLSPKGRKMIVFELTRYLRASQGQDTVNRWEDDVAPFFERVWPREAKYQSPDTAQQMKECCDCAGERSEQARELLMPYMQSHT